MSDIYFLFCQHDLLHHNYDGSKLFTPDLKPANINKSLGNKVTLRKNALQALSIFLLPMK